MLGPPRRAQLAADWVNPRAAGFSLCPFQRTAGRAIRRPGCRAVAACHQSWRFKILMDAQQSFRAARRREPFLCRRRWKELSSASHCAHNVADMGTRSLSGRVMHLIEITAQRLERVSLLLNFRLCSKAKPAKDRQRRTPPLYGMLQQKSGDDNRLAGTSFQRTKTASNWLYGGEGHDPINRRARPTAHVGDDQ